MARDAKEQLQKRVESEAQASFAITNNSLVCKNCLLRFDDAVAKGNVSRCEVYPVCKPMVVLGGGGCAYYVKE